MIHLRLDRVIAPTRKSSLRYHSGQELFQVSDFVVGTGMADSRILVEFVGGSHCL